MTCPCSMGQAYTDRGRYIVGADCDDEEPEAPCPFRPNAQICFVSRLPSYVKLAILIFLQKTILFLDECDVCALYRIQ